ncbi:MAG: PAS domain-containing protein [bacterium]|nr:PAS domain-containing protein [bacterium]
MGAEEISLLGHLDAPILVGDPEGCVVYANPSFRDRFCQMSGDPVGEPLAMVFGGGAREVVLTATAQVLQRGQPSRLQIREGGHAYTGLCSPIEAEDDRVGVVMVMLEEHSNEEHLTSLADELGEPLSDALQAMSALNAELDGRLNDRQQQLMLSGIHQMETAQKWLRELSMALRGGKAQQGRFDVSSSILRVTERISQEIPSSVDLDVLMPPNLPRVSGATVVFERLLSQLVRQRIDESRPEQPITILARTIGGDRPSGVLVSVVDVPEPDRRGPTGHPPESVQQGLGQMGGEAVCVEDGSLGRVTSMRLAVASA